MVGTGDPLPLPAQRVDGPGALHGLGQPVGHRRVRGVLPQVAGRRPVQVPAGADPDDRYGDQQRQGQQRPDQHQRADHQEHRDHRDHRLGHREPHAPRQRVDVTGGPGQQVTRAGPLHGGQRQAEHPLDELLAQVGQDPLAEAGRGQMREVHQNRLHHHETGDRPGEPVDHPDPVVVLDRLDEIAQQPRPGQAGDRRHHVQPDREAERARVAPEQIPGVPPDLGGIGHRQHGAHSSSSRSTARA